MATNFICQIDRRKDKIRLKLYGDFDGSSAFELLNILNSHRSGAYRIFIDTDNLNMIHSFGLDILKRNLNILDINKNKIIIIGKNKIYLESIRNHHNN